MVGKISHYDLSFSYFFIVQFYVITDLSLYMVLVINYRLVYIVDLESNRITYLNTLTTSSCHAYWMIPTSSGSCPSILSGPPVPMSLHISFHLLPIWNNIMKWLSSQGWILVRIIVGIIVGHRHQAFPTSGKHTTTATFSFTKNGKTNKKS